MRIGWFAAACAFLFSPRPLAAQDSTTQDSAVRVFLDCPDVQVHVLVTTQQTAGGRRRILHQPVAYKTEPGAIAGLRVGDRA